MSMEKTISFYSKILKKSFGVMLAQKEWWALAVIAGLVHTGAIFNMLIRTFLYIAPANKLNYQNIKQISPFFSWVLESANNLANSGTTHIVAYASATMAMFILIALLALIAQFIILFVVSNGEKNLSWKDIKKKLHHLHILRLIAVNASMRISFTIIIGLTMLVLTLITTQSFVFDSLQRIAVYAIAIPIAFFIQIFCMTALVLLVKKDASIGKVVTKTINILRDYWIIGFEFALILFVINFISSGALFVLLMIVTILAAFIFEITLAAGSYILLSFVTFMTLLICASLILIYAGATTTFNYSVWNEMCAYLQRYSRFPILKHALSKILDR